MLESILANTRLRAQGVEKLRLGRSSRLIHNFYTKRLDELESHSPSTIAGAVIVVVAVIEIGHRVAVKLRDPPSDHTQRDSNK